MSSFILGAIVGFLLALLILYWKQITFLYRNQDTIGAASQIVSGFQVLGQKL